MDGHEASREEYFAPQSIEVMRLAVPGLLLQEEHEKRKKDQKYTQEPQVAPEGIKSPCQNHYTK
jgi:hypothetical protein